MREHIRIQLKHSIFNRWLTYDQPDHNIFLLQVLRLMLVTVDSTEQSISLQVVRTAIHIHHAPATGQDVLSLHIKLHFTHSSNQQHTRHLIRPALSFPLSLAHAHTNKLRNQAFETTFLLKKTQKRNYEPSSSMSSISSSE